MTHELSVVLPIYNQADHLEAVVRAIAEVLRDHRYRFELILVPNACRDESEAVCRALAETVPEVRVVVLVDGGWGRAVAAGLAASSGEVLCYANSARTHPSDLLQVVGLARANRLALIKAHRRSRESLDRRLGSFLFNGQCRLLFKLATWDINATPKAFSRDIYERVVRHACSPGDLFDLECHVICRERNVPTLEVPTYNWQRHAGRSTTNYRSAVRLYVGAITMWRARRGRLAAATGIQPDV